MLGKWAFKVFTSIEHLNRVPHKCQHAKNLS